MQSNPQMFFIKLPFTHWNFNKKNICSYILKISSYDSLCKNVFQTKLCLLFMLIIKDTN